MKKLAIGLAAVVTLLALAYGALYLYAGSKFTVCYGIFDTRDAAERAADAGRDADFDVYVEHRRRESAVEFETGETGEDATDARRAYREILRREGCSSGHGKTGCLEREPFM